MWCFATWKADGLWLWLVHRDLGGDTEKHGREAGRDTWKTHMWDRHLDALTTAAILFKSKLLLFQHSGTSFRTPSLRFPGRKCQTSGKLFRLSNPATVTLFYQGNLGSVSGQLLLGISSLPSLWLLTPVKIFQIEESASLVFMYQKVFGSLGSPSHIVTLILISQKYKMFI